MTSTPRARLLAVIGDVNPDVVVSAADLTIAFGQRESLVDEATLCMGGSASITACAAARLGVPTTLFGVVGRDDFGVTATRLLAAAGVSIDGLVVSDECATSVSVVLQRGDDRAILTQPSSIHALTANRLNRALLDTADHIHVGGYYLLQGMWDDLPGVFAAARARGATTSLDPNWDPSERFALDTLLPHVDVLLPNAEEARRIAGRDNLASALRHLAQTVPVVAVTDGVAGAVCATGHRLLRVAAPAIDAADVVDAIGAGDTFDAGFLAAWLATGDVASALRTGVAAATLSVQRRGGTGAHLDRTAVDAVAATVVVDG